MCDLHNNWNPCALIHQLNFLSSSGKMKLVMMTQQNHITMATVEQSVVIVIRAKQKCVWWGLDGFILLILVFSSRPLQSYHDTSLGHAHSSTTVTAILVTLMLVCALAALGCYVFKHKTDAFRFHYFRVRHTHTMLLVVLVTVFLFFYIFASLAACDS